MLYPLSYGRVPDPEQSVYIPALRLTAGMSHSAAISCDRLEELVAGIQR